MKEKLICVCSRENPEKEKLIRELTLPYRLKHHTGGKPVFSYKSNSYFIVCASTPGDVERLSTAPDCVLLILDSRYIESELHFAKKIISKHKNCIVFLSHIKAAEKAKIITDKCKLKTLLSIPLIAETPHSVRGINRLLEELHLLLDEKEKSKGKKRKIKSHALLIIFAVVSSLIIAAILIAQQ